MGDGLRADWFGIASRWYGPAPANAGFSWVGAERIAIGSVPTRDSLELLPGAGVTHVVNCRTRTQVLIHCQQGRRRSAMVAYAVLRLRGHEPEAASALIVRHRAVAELVPAYTASVEDWLSSAATRG